MYITDVLIEERIKEKILQKHNVSATEIKAILLNKPYALRARENRYMAIGRRNRFITIIFTMKKTTAFIITAYPSSDAQIKLYKSKRL